MFCNAKEHGQGRSESSPTGAVVPGASSESCPHHHPLSCEIIEQVLLQNVMNLELKTIAEGSIKVRKVFYCYRCVCVPWQASELPVVGSPVTCQSKCNLIIYQNSQATSSSSCLLICFCRKFGYKAALKKKRQ